MTTEAERDCKHGQLARSCNVCELEAEVVRQAAEIEQLKSEMEDQYPCIERLRTAVALKNGVIKTLQDEANDARLEIERLNNCLRLEQNRMERIGTHANDCYKWGPAHWECAIREIERLKEALAASRVQALEEAAKVCDEVQDIYGKFTFTARVSAERIRALIGGPT